MSWIRPGHVIKLPQRPYCLILRQHPGLTYFPTGFSKPPPPSPLAGLFLRRVLCAQNSPLKIKTRARGWGELPRKALRLTAAPVTACCSTPPRSFPAACPWDSGFLLGQAVTRAAGMGAPDLVSQLRMGGLTLEAGKPEWNPDCSCNQLIHSFTPGLVTESVIN